MSKQDRQGVRTPADIERKYDLGQDYSKAIKIANDAQRAATNAQDIAANANNTASELSVRVEALENSGGGGGGDSPGTTVDLGLSIVDGKLCVTYTQGE